MATITGLTAERMLAIEGASVVDGDVVGDHLILTRHDGTQIDSGIVKGADSTVPGPTGPAGSPAYPTVVNGSWIKGVGGVPVWTAITQADVSGLVAALAAKSGVLDRMTTLTQYGNSLAENTLYTYSVPGNTMGALGALRLTLLGRFNSQSTGSNVYTFRIKFGGTTIYQGDSSSYAGSGQPLGAFFLELIIQNLNATNLQNMNGIIGMNRSTANTGLGAMASGAAAMPLAVSADAALDTTSAKVLAVTCQMSGQNSSNTIVVRSALLELL